jgi:hypothetical protein
MNKLIRASVLIAAAATLLPAQTTATAPTVAEIVAARVARLTKLLTLTTAQATQATSLFTTEVTAEQTIDTNLATARTALTTAIEANSATGITAAATTIGNLTMQRAVADGTAEAAFYAILTTAQQTIYQELLAAGLQDCGPGSDGRGGPGGGH